MGVASGCGYQEVGVASGWNLWVWLECVGVVSGWCCKEVYRYPHNIIYPYSTCISSFFCSSIPTSLFILFLFFLSLNKILTMLMDLNTYFNLYMSINKST